MFSLFIKAQTQLNWVLVGAAVTVWEATQTSLFLLLQSFAFSFNPNLSFPIPWSSHNSIPLVLSISISVLLPFLVLMAFLLITRSFSPIILVFSDWVFVFSFGSVLGFYLKLLLLFFFIIDGDLVSLFWGESLYFFWIKICICEWKNLACCFMIDSFVFTGISPSNTQKKCSNG